MEETEPLGIKKNLAQDLDKETLTKIGLQCKEDYELDRATGADWRDSVEEWLKLAAQVSELKNYPWPNASNIKYPLVSVAAMQFSARSYPTLVPSDGKVVKPIVIGKDEDGAKLEKAQKVAKFMSWQIMHDMDGWEEDMDRLLLLVAIMGTMFKKTFYDYTKDKVCSKLVDPRELTINYFADCINNAQRISENIYLYDRELNDRVNSEAYLDVDLPSPTISDYEDNEDYGITESDEALPHFLVEQECWISDFKRGYPDVPVTVVFHKSTGTVLAIYPRFFDDDLVQRNEKVIRINAHTSYTKYGFIPNPHSAIYDLGFGHLLGPLNDSVNTIINQLVDAGTLSNLQSGFIGKGIRIPKGEQVLKPGEWKSINAMGDDLRKQIVPLPTKEPSNVLFQLLGSLITSGKELASVAEIFVGKMPGQNTPATTTMATIEQGMKVFTAIYKRVYRSLSSEFKKIYKLNNKYLDSQTMVAVLDEAVNPEDFDSVAYDICPGADPTAVSGTERLLKAQGLMELMSMFPTMLDPIKVLSRILEAQEQPNWEELIPGMVETGQAQIPPPPPDPKQMEMEMKMKAEQEKHGLKAEEMQRKMAMEERSAESQLKMKEHEANINLQSKAAQANLDRQIAEHKQKIFMVDSAQKVQQKETEHVQKSRQSEEQHRLKQQQQKTSPSGNKAKSPKK